MKNTKQTIWLLLALNLALVALLLGGRFFWCKRGVDAAVYNNAIASLKELYKNQKNISAWHIYTNGMVLSRDLELQTEKEAGIRLDSVTMNTMLVLRYTELNCNSCVDLILSEILAQNSFNEQNTLLLAYYQNPSYLYQFKRMNRLQFPVFSVKSTGLPTDTLNLPYLFLLDKNMQINHMYIPEEGDTASIRQYLGFAKEKLLKQR